MKILPTISVIIPTYHRNDLLALCLDRLAPGRQTLDAREYEVIVTDDGSASTARQMVAEQYPWAQWVAGPRKGPAANRNNGVAHATGQWLAFTDDDCLPEPGWLAAFAAAADLNSPVLEGKTTCNAGIQSPLDHSPLNLTGGLLWSCNLMVLANFFRVLGGFDHAYPRPHMEDVDFRQRVADAGVVARWTPLAAVDHPPRRVKLFRAIAMDHECEVIYQTKHGLKPRLVPMLFNTLRARAQTLLRFGVSRDWLLFGVSTVFEAFWFVVYFRGWTARHLFMGASANAAASRSDHLSNVSAPRDGTAD